MGVWGQADPNVVDIPWIAEQMRDALYQWMSAHIQIYDQNSGSVGDYDPTADLPVGGRTLQTLVLDSGEDGAIVQPIRSPSRIDFAGQGNTIIGIRFQVKKIDPSVVLRAGLRIRVVSGGEDDSLPNYTFALQGAVDSSLKWGHILEAVVVQGGVSDGAGDGASGYGAGAYGA